MARWPGCGRARGVGQAVDEGAFFGNELVEGTDVIHESFLLRAGCAPWPDGRGAAGPAVLCRRSTKALSLATSSLRARTSYMNLSCSERVARHGPMDGVAPAPRFYHG